MHSLGRKQYGAAEPIVRVALFSFLAAWSGCLARACLYTIAEGDTVAQLAAAQGCNAGDIKIANPGVNWGALETGMILFIPEVCECPPYPECTITTTAIENNLDRVANTRGCFSEEVRAFNPGADFGNFTEGTEVKIPSDRCRCALEVVGCGYVAKAGDTVEGLTAQLNCPASAADSIAAYNPGLFPYWAPELTIIPLEFQLLIPPVCDCPTATAPPPPPPPVLLSDPSVSLEVGSESGPDATGSTPPSSSDDATWQTFGIAIAVSVALMVAAVLAWVALRRRRAARRQHEALAAADREGKQLQETFSSAPSARQKERLADSVTRKMTGADSTSVRSQSCPRTGMGSAPASATPTVVSTPVQGQAGSNPATHHVELSWITHLWTDSSSAQTHATQTARLGQYFITQSNITMSQPSRPLFDAPPLTESPYQGAVEYLQDVLDDMSTSASLLLSRWAVLSSNDRRIGGQGVVQFVWDTKTRQDHVAKFFLNEDTFQREAQLYSRPKMREMMAAVVHVQESGVQTANGDPLPSFIVLKRGSSLDEWALKRKPDFATSLQVLMQIIERLVNLHDAGYVHRDLKPANILWRTEDNDWTIIDFGCVADLGESSTAHLACSLPYAPPEVAEAAENGQSSIEVDPASDIWSLGIVVYELLTGDRVFPRGTPQRVVFDQLLGRAPLPWEAGAPQETQRKVRKLGVLRRAVLSCLSRVPSQRPTAQKLLLTLNALFQGTQSKTD